MTKVYLEPNMEEIERFCNAAKNGCVDGLKQLYAEFGPNILNRKSVVGRTPLIYATWYGHVAAARFLLDSGADAEAKSSDSETPLMFAAYGGGQKKSDMIKLLLDHGVDINAQDDLGRTVVMYAVAWGTPETLMALLERGADWNIRNKKGQNLLEWATVVENGDARQSVEDFIEQQKQVERELEETRSSALKALRVSIKWKRG